MKQVFKKGDYVDINGLEKSVIDAIIDRFRADGWGNEIPNLDLRYRFLGIDPMGVLDTSPCDFVKKLTVEECLFAGAPEWAVDVRLIIGCYRWSDGNGRMLYLGEDGNGIIYLKY